MEIKMSIKGLDQTIGALDRYSLEARGRVRTAVRNTAKEIRTEARRNAPVRSGKLRKSIKMRIEKNGLTAEVRSSKFYGTFIEYGTVHQPARPFMQPAFDKALPGFEQEIKEALR